MLRQSHLVCRNKSGRAVLHLLGENTLPLNHTTGILTCAPAFCKNINSNQRKAMRQRPIAATIFGILNIGFGVLDLVVTLFSMIVLPRMNMAGNAILKQMQEDAWTKITMPLDGIAAVALLAAGIGLLLLQNWARILSMIYAVYSILVGIVGCIVKLNSGTSGIMMVLTLIGGMVNLVYPILLVIFMMKPNVVAALKPAPPVT
jgi:hypothetical protein